MKILEIKNILIFKSSTNKKNNIIEVKSKLYNGPISITRTNIPLKISHYENEAYYTTQ